MLQHCHQSVHTMNTDLAPSGRQPSDQSSRLGLYAATIYTHSSRSLLSLMKTWVDLGGWLYMYNKMVYLLTDDHPSQY